VKAVRFERKGGPEVLEYVDVADPTPGEGQALVNVEAIGVNYRDIHERERDGYGAAAPAIIGTEAGGTTDEGERLVWAHGTASYAEKVAVDRGKAVPIPDGVPTDVAVAAILQGMTAYYLAHESYPIQEGDRVLVHAAAGGVGLLLTQIAKLRGGYVIGTASTGEKRELARGAGADEAIGYDELEGVRDIAVVYDGVGKTTFDDGLNALRPLGHMIIYGAASAEPDPVDVRRLMSGGSLYVQRPTLATYTRTPELLRDLAGKLFALIAQGKLDVRIGQRYQLAEARQAHEDLAARRTTGKLLLVP
jgi:NADPH2:quinone reductase